jgi:copper chaperone CopZ
MEDSMKSRTRICLTLTALILAVAPLWAQSAAMSTTITIPRMDCPTCAGKVEAKLNEVPGVAALRTDVEKRTVVVTPRNGVVLSPRALWEAVEKGGKMPSRLQGPSGTFTTKPKS